MAQIQLTRGGVERGKQLVGRISAGFDQGIEQRGFARVGIAHQRNGEGIATVALTTLGAALLFDFLKPLFGALDGVVDHAAVQLYLGLPWAATHTNTAALALQVRPTAHQARTEVLQLGQLDLQLAFVAACTLGKDFQNQQGAVVHRHAHVTLKIALLRGAERLVKQNLGGTMHEGQLFDFVSFTAADKQCGIWGFAFTGDARHRLQARGFG